MNPGKLFPLLALLFLALSAWTYARTRRWHGASSTWALLAFIFAIVSAWLRYA